MNEEKPPNKAFEKYEALMLKALDPKVMNPLLRKPKPSIYPRFGDRATASLLDCCWVVLLLSPVIAQIRPLIYGSSSLQATPVRANGVQDYFQQLHSSGLLEKLLLENFVTFIITFFIVVAMWSYASATPGKWVTRMRIVRDGDFGKPTMQQWCIRYTCYLLIFPGFLWILLDPKRRALHDLIARTVVVRVKHWRIADDGTLPHLREEDIAAENESVR